MTKKIILFNALLIAALLCWGGATASAGYQVGDTVADFTLNDAYGDSVSLYDYQGMGVLLHFWGSC